MPLTSDEIRFLINRNEKLKSIRALYEPLWQEIAEFIFPRRVAVGSQISQGAKQTERLYDSTAIHSNELLAASMHGTLTPSSSRWFGLKLRDDRLNKVKEVMDWLEVCADRMYLAFNQSNFNSEIHEVFLDEGAFGTACILVEERPLNGFGFAGLLFRALYNSEYCIDEDANGKVDTLFREFELSARAAIARWGEKNLSERIVKRAEKEPDERFKFLHCIFPSKDNGEFSSFYLEVEDKRLLSEKKYIEFPAMVPRWSKSSGEIYGRGPGHTALPDVKSLNKARELGLKVWAKDLDPPTFEKDGAVIGSLRLYPGGRNIARDKDSIWHLDSHARHDVSQIKEEQLKQSIRQIFYSDQLKLQEGPEMTATEVQVRYELMQRLLGPTVGRNESELLNPLIERIFAILMRASSGRFQILPPPPVILARMGANEIDIEYEGPLARAQRMSEFAASQRLINLGATMYNVKPDILDNVDTDAAFRNAADVLGVPSKIIRSEEEVMKMREERARIQAQETQKQDLERLAAGLKNASPVIKALEGAKGAEGATPQA